MNYIHLLYEGSQISLRIIWKFSKKKDSKVIMKLENWTKNF